MFLSQEIDIKLWQNYTETYKCKILYKIFNIKQIFIFYKYATNLKTMTSQRSLRNSGVLLSLFEFNNFSFIIGIIDNIIYAPGSCHQNSNRWQCSIITMCLRRHQVTSILHCHWREFWSRIRMYIEHIYVVIILTQFYIHFLRQEHQIDV